MKKTLTIIFITLSALLILDSMGTAHAMAMFLLAGIVPGTNIAISADRMLEFFALLIGFVLARVSIQLSRAITHYREASAPLVKRTRTAKTLQTV